MAPAEALDGVDLVAPAEVCLLVVSEVLAQGPLEELPPDGYATVVRSLSSLPFGDLLHRARPEFALLQQPGQEAMVQEVHLLAAHIRFEVATLERWVLSPDFFHGLDLPVFCIVL